jgi:hypothetical protein
LELEQFANGRNGIPRRPTVNGELRTVNGYPIENQFTVLSSPFTVEGETRSGNMNAASPFAQTPRSWQTA